MENNNSKQAVLSIIGIAILVIAVVGVSFAFFSYSRTGAKNNVITTGSITFTLDPGKEEEGEQPTIKGDDTFPEKDDEDGPKDPDNRTDFDVEGTLPEGANPVTYWVYAIPGDAPEGKAPSGVDWIPFDDDEINMYITATGAQAGEITYVSDFNGTSGDTVPGYETPMKDGSGNGLLLATGKLEAGKTIAHKYSLHMWVNSTVNVSDTDSSYTYRASSTEKGDLPAGQESDDREIYSDHYYAVKIKVVASDDPSLAS